MKITRELLKKKRACAPSRKEFDRVFPNGIRLTRKNLMKAVKLSKISTEGIYKGELLLDIIWVIQKLFKNLFIEYEEKIFMLETRIHNKKISERKAQYRVAKWLADELNLK